MTQAEETTTKTYCRNMSSVKNYMYVKLTLMQSGKLKPVCKKRRGQQKHDKARLNI